MPDANYCAVPACRYNDAGYGGNCGIAYLETTSGVRIITHARDAANIYDMQSVFVGIFR